MGEFQDRLWRELAQAHGEELARVGTTANGRGWRVGNRLLAGVSLAVAAFAAAAAVALGLGAANTSPAFAVNRNADGSVTVSITRADAIASANARLAALGIRARAVPVLRGCIVAPPVLRLARSPRIVALAPQARGRLLRPTKVAEVRFYPGRIPARAMLILDTYLAHGKLRVAARHWMLGNVPPCLPRTIVAPLMPVRPAAALARRAAEHSR